VIKAKPIREEEEEKKTPIKFDIFNDDEGPTN